MPIRKWSAVALLVAAAILTRATEADAQDIPCMKGKTIVLDGTCWNNLSPDQRTSAMFGMFAGISTRSWAVRLQGNRVSDIPRGWTVMPSSTTVGDVESYFDQLYRTPANREIKWEWAYILAGMNARDDDSNDSRSLLKFLREHGDVPTSGNLVGATGPDTIVVRTDKGDFEVKLEGVTADGLTPQQKATATAFLKGLSQSDSFINAIYKGRAVCKPPEGANVTLNYGTQIFSDDNQLSATVTLLNFDELCMGNQPVTLEYLAKAGGFADPSTEISLNALVLSIGLALPDTQADPKWPEAIVRDRDLSSVSERAKEAERYIFGPGRNGLIDQVVNIGLKATN
ncbi:hypothetical protein FRZ44_21340 [Hypericibacter terrae]|uniref:Lipoprotein n=1 Tax=Hypericibacter terrae TaxID=2602015 RepID=A0A5J6MHA6_9PROT|nr:hypothetical protein [Hypericibacter terrae]QEX16839.1 hypothetical protein FRZ44_21340 [Hypericibacter terrae]